MGRRTGDQAVRLKGLMTVRRGGKVYHYLRHRGQPLVALPSLPTHHPDFLAAYAAAARHGPSSRSKAVTGSMAALLEAASSSDTFLAFKPGYRALLRRHFDGIRQSFGALPAAGVRERHIKADISQSTDPVARHKAWRFIGSWGKEATLLAEDPAEGVKGPKRKETAGHPPWTADEIDAYRARWPIGTVARAAMELLFFTGARISDGVQIGPQHVDRDGVLTFIQQKTGEPAHVPWSCPLPKYGRTMEADRAMMRDSLAPLAGHLTFLPARGKRRSEKALGTLIQKAAEKADVPKSAHGLRKARAVALAEAGATTHQIAAWTGHKSLKEVEHYTLAASRKKAVMGEIANPSHRSAKRAVK